MARQFPDVVLDRLPLITKPDGAAATRRLRAMAFLGPLVSLYTGRHRLNVDARTGGLKQLSGRMRIQVIPRLANSIPAAVFTL